MREERFGQVEHFDLAKSALYQSDFAVSTRLSFLASRTVFVLYWSFLASPRLCFSFLRAFCLCESLPMVFLLLLGFSMTTAGFASAGGRAFVSMSIPRFAPAARRFFLAIAEASLRAARVGR